MTSQTAFRTAVLDPASAVPPGLVNPDGTAATRRFDVYRNNVAVGLTEALETGFPVLRKLVGAEFFRAMAGVFLRRYPPRSPLMMQYGAEMPEFLAGFAPVAHLPYLPDISLVELALRQAYHAADAAPLDPGALAAISEDGLSGLRLRFAPAVTVLSSDYPIHAIWRANTGGDRAATSGGQSVMISRADYDPQIDLLSSAQAKALSRLLSGGALGDVCDHPDFAALLALLLARSAIVAIHTEE